MSGSTSSIEDKIMDSVALSNDPINLAAAALPPNLLSVIASEYLNSVCRASSKSFNTWGETFSRVASRWTISARLFSEISFTV